MTIAVMGDSQRADIHSALPGNPADMPRVLLPRTTRTRGLQQGFNLISQLGELGLSTE